MSADLDNLVNEVQVIVQVVFLLGIQHVATVAYGGLDHAASLIYGLHTNLKLVDVVQSIEDAEHINAVLLGLFAEMVDGVVGQRRISNAVGTTQKHLEGYIGHKFPHLPQAVPRILVQEAHGDVERCSTPALQAVAVAQSPACLPGNVQEINSSDPGCKQRLVGITPGSVHQQAAFVGADRLGKCLGSFLVDDVFPSFRAWLGYVEWLTITIKESRHDNVGFGFRLTNLTLDAAPIHSDVSQVCQQLLSAILTTDQG